MRFKDALSGRRTLVLLALFTVGCAGAMEDVTNMFGKLRLPEGEH